MANLVEPKVCKGCKILLPASDFGINRSYGRISNLRSYCFKCDAERRAKRVSSEKDYALRTSLWHKYRLTLEAYYLMLKSQNNTCFICKESFEGQINVDHNHMTGQNRALLCSKCNFRVGLVEKTPDTLMKVFDYIGKFGELRVPGYEIRRQDETN